ncbi:MAG: Gfo/Idh/MocA family oxidoreductase [Candidatus Peribacteraceae bacterium]|jgi:predicted dehydrogenase|nr:Gfo/Idh/MocA family oxidoreductase [Candidatus Peribacteraceae bacterium]|tara:strand:- start:3032 stop:3994 length:963 start_codon:yes stop_codon:yes gene_type:complete
MKILIIGYSSIVRRRIISALHHLDEITGVDLATRRPGEVINPLDSEIGNIYGCYREALAQTDAELVYISLINSLHGHWVEAALQAGKHVVVDKPAFLSLAETKRLAKMADRAGLCLAEAIVIGDHPQFNLVRNLVEIHGGITRLFAVFSIPPFSQSNYRNHSELGGGALLDMGSYVAALGWLLFKKEPEEVVCRVLDHHAQTQVDTAFSVLVRYPDAGCFVGHFGFDTEYQNRITAIGPQISIALDRVFTIPPDFENKIFVTRQNKQSIITCPSGDTFLLFFSRLVKAIKLKAWAEFSQDMLRNVFFREQMRRSAQENAI